MALVVQIKKGQIKSRTSIHKPTDCTYYIVLDEKGKKYLQIDTIGSIDRAIQGKVSQSIQFSKEVIDALKDIFAKEFNF